jgi:N utilization substance protein B
VAARSKARKRALDVLFEAELRGLPVLGLLAERMSLGEQPTPEYAAEIVRGVCAHRDEIDALMADNAVGWTLDRMPAVDRNVLRIGVWELLWADDVPDGVAISEAVALAQDLSTDGSPAFVNGLLAKVKQLKPGVAAAKAEADAKAEAAEAAAKAEAAEAGEAVAPGKVGGEGEAAATGEAGAKDESSSAEATSAAAGPDQVTQAARRAALARATRSGRGLVKPPRVATRPASSEERDSSDELARRAVARVS